MASADSLCGNFGNFGESSWAGDAACLGSVLNDIIRGPQQPIYNVYPNGDGSTRGVQGEPIEEEPQGVSPLIIGAAAAGTLLVGIVLVKVLD